MSNFRSDLDPAAGLPPSEQTLPPPPAGLPGPPVAPRRSAWASLAAVVGLLAVKLKSALALLKVASLGKFALTAFSMLAMIAVEAHRGGWLFGLGFVAMIFVHEMGHAIAIRQAGLQAGWPVFIPFFGAMITLKGRPASRAVEARIAYAGPLAGTAASLVAAALFLLTGSRVWLALAYTGFFLNLFNLIPISPLDGGRVAQIFSRRASILGGVLLGAMFLVTLAPQLLLIGIVAVMHNFRRGDTEDSAMSAATAAERSTWSFLYFGLCFFLGAGIYFASRLLRGGLI